MDFPRIGLGCFPLSLPSINDKAALGLISSAIDIGYRLFNTSNTYGAGRSEKLLGKALKGKRRNVIIVSKGGYTDNYEHYGKPEEIIKSCEDSLRRLQTDYIDVYELHSPDPNVPLEETMGAFLKLKEQGKIREAGISQCSFEEILRVNKVIKLFSVEMEYSLRVRGVEDKILPWCGKNNKYLLAYVPIGRGYLTSRLGPKRPGLAPYNPKYQGKELAKTIAGSKKLEKIAKKLKCTIAQLSLAYLINKSKITVPIPGATEVWQLKENFGSLDIHLDKSVLNSLPRIFG